MNFTISRQNRETQRKMPALEKKQKDGNPKAEQNKFMKPVQDCKAPVSETTEPQKIFMVAPNGMR